MYTTRSVLLYYFILLNVSLLSSSEHFSVGKIGVDLSSNYYELSLLRRGGKSEGIKFLFRYISRNLSVQGETT